MAKSKNTKEDNSATITIDKKEAATKSLDNTTVDDTNKNVDDLQVYGNENTFQLICETSNKKEGWMKSTKAMHIIGVGCVLQVTTKQRNKDGSYSIAEAITFVPGVNIVALNRDIKQGRTLVKM